MTHDNLWVLDGVLQTARGSAIARVLSWSFDDEPGSHVTVTDTTVQIHWRSVSPLGWASLASTIRGAAPDVLGTVMVTFPDSDDSSPVFLVFHSDHVAVHGAQWTMDPHPFLRFSHEPAIRPIG